MSGFHGTIEETRRAGALTPNPPLTTLLHHQGVAFVNHNIIPPSLINSPTNDPLPWWPHDLFETDVSTWERFNGRATARRLDVLAKSEGACWYCGANLDVAHMHMDHVQPLRHGGPDCDGNIVPACPTCNMSKGCKTLDEWREKAALRLTGTPRFTSEQRQWLAGQGFQFPELPPVVFWFEVQGLVP